MSRTEKLKTFAGSGVMALRRGWEAPRRISDARAQPRFQHASFHYFLFIVLNFCFNPAAIPLHINSSFSHNSFNQHAGPQESVQRPPYSPAAQN